MVWTCWSFLSIFTLTHGPWSSRVEISLFLIFPADNCPLYYSCMFPGNPFSKDIRMTSLNFPPCYHSVRMSVGNLAIFTLLLRNHPSKQRNRKNDLPQISFCIILRIPASKYEFFLRKLSHISKRSKLPFSFGNLKIKTYISNMFFVIFITASICKASKS